MKQLLIAAVVAASLAACGDADPPADRAAPDAGVAAETASPASGPTIDAPLQEAEVGATVTHVGSTSYNPANGLMTIRFNVANTGTTTLVSAGDHPVRLGVQLVRIADGATELVNMDFVRVELPAIAPGEAVEVEAQVPADLALGNGLKVLPVQEGVAWFDHFGVDALVIGPVEQCADRTIGVCAE